MPRIFAIDWDRSEARAILMQSGPTGTSVSGVWAASLDVPEGTALTGKLIGARLAEVMAGQTVGNATTILGVGRDHVQIKLMSLPPAPDDELPELVRFQAEREFTALGSAAALDYIPLSGDAETPHQVLAVALSPAGIAEARDAAQALSAEPERITVRALAAVSLVERSGVVRDDSIILIVNPLGDEADLTVLDRGKVVLMRTVKLPDADQAPARHRSLLGEIRRTVAAARQQSSDRPIDQVLFCGNAAAVDKVDGLSEELDIKVNLIDPAQHAPAGFANAKVAPESLARFSAVLGMALAEADRQPPIVDFLNVRRRAEKQRFSRQHAQLAALAAVLVLAVGTFLWLRQHAVAVKLAAIKQEIADAKAEMEESAEQTTQANAVDKWLSRNVNWLDEFEMLSRRIRPTPLPKTPDDEKNNPFPANRDVVMRALQFSHPADAKEAGGMIKVTQALAKDNILSLSGVEGRLRSDGRSKVSPAGVKPAPNLMPGYGIAFDLTISVPPPEELADVEDPSAAKPQPAAAEKPAAEATKAEAPATEKAPLATPPVAKENNPAPVNAEGK
jgi:Tfp pilus assembly PilM family ATPase